MRLNLRWIAILLWIASCKSEKVPLGAKSNDVALQKQQQQSAQEILNIENQPLDFDAAFADFMRAIEEFENSAVYANPQTEEQRLLVQLAVCFKNIQKDSLQEAIVSGRFYQLFEALQYTSDNTEEAWNLLQATDILLSTSQQREAPAPEDINIIAAISTSNLDPKIASAANKAGSTSGSGETGASESQKKHVLNGAYFLAALGAAGMLFGTAEVAHKVLHKGFFQGEGFSKRPIGNLVEAMVVLGKFSLFLFTGAVAWQAVTAGDVSAGKTQVQTGLFIVAALGLVGAMYFTVAIWANTAGKKWLDPYRTPGLDPSKYFFYPNVTDLLQQSKNVWYPQAKAILAPGEKAMSAVYTKYKGDRTFDGFFVKVKGSDGQVTEKEVTQWENKPSWILPTSRRAQMAKAGIWASILTGAAVGAIVYAQDGMNLFGQGLPPENVFVLQAARFYEICDALSAQKTLKIGG